MNLTSSSVESSAAALTLEVLGLLMRYKDLQIIEIAFTYQMSVQFQIEEMGARTVITERPRQDLLDIGVATLLLAAGHVERFRKAVVRAK